MKLTAISAGTAVVLKTLLPLILGIVVLVGVVAWMIGSFEEKIQADEDLLAPPKATAEQRANTYQVEERIKPYFEEAVGTLKAADRTDISARVMAPINEMRVRAGQVVAEGDVLLVLESRALETQRNQAETNLMAARAALRRAENDYRRAAQLLKTRTISEEEADQITENLKVSQASLKDAQEALAEAGVMLSYTTILAPKPGMIAKRLAEQGDMARPGEPLLILYDPRSLRLEAPVTEDLAVHLKPGDELEGVIDARDQKIKVVIDEVVPQAEAATRSFLVKAKLPRSDDLFEGMSGRLKIPAGIRRHLCLHTGAIETVGQLQFVTVVGKDDVLERRFIKTGRLGDLNHREVLSGLRARERVLLKSPPEAHNDAKSDST